MTNCTSLKEIDDVRRCARTEERRALCKTGLSCMSGVLQIHWLIETTDAQHALFTSVTACTHSDPLRLNSPEGKAGMSPSVVSSSSRLSTTLPKAKTKRKRLTKEYSSWGGKVEGRGFGWEWYLSAVSIPRPLTGVPTGVTLVGDLNVSPRAPDCGDRGCDFRQLPFLVTLVPNSRTTGLRCELGKMNARGIPYDQFLGVIHPTLKKLPLDLLRKVKGPLRKLRDEYLEVVDNKDSLERDLYAPFAEMVSSIIKANGGRDRLRENAREEEASRDLNPDGVFVRKRRGRRAPTSPDQVHWRDILFPIDLKRKENCRASLLPLTSDSEMTEEQKERESEKVGEATLDGRQ
ncbi:uncharacterized protein EI90DRAFT_3016552 [Cantharellus anzutake]|uniref:uncharacterized protein n=1 Tax=Cantharellus anzutake TaxID=1750568 RepID=UPI0019076640|nr:uncharacterized protein EI90DRAFT_3016552 [Cantharellus anzutake]KAF8331121.1 hypothetical protein EI90DRAFT_3016552 [Cantharellus anzutake]